MCDDDDDDNNNNSIVIIMSTFVKRKINGPQMRYALFKFLVFH